MLRIYIWCDLKPNKINNQRTQAAVIYIIYTFSILSIKMFHLLYEYLLLARLHYFMFTQKVCACSTGCGRGCTLHYLTRTYSNKPNQHFSHRIFIWFGCSRRIYILHQSNLCKTGNRDIFASFWWRSTIKHCIITIITVTFVTPLCNWCVLHFTVYGLIA